ncbi:MAG TPA: SIR2 family protein, partial [Thermoanaerobaculia bacterium]
MSRIVGFGAERIEPPVHATREEIIYRRRVMLARCLNLKTAVAFLGAGCSVPLGYPRWPAFAHGVLKATADALEQTTDPHNREYRAQIEQMSARLTAAEKPAAPDLLFYLGRCQRIATALRKSGITDPYADYVQRTFGPQAPDPRRSNSGENPHLALLDLPISRFITTNYDVELELALSARSPRLRPHYGLDSEMAGDDAPADLTRLSFTQKEAYYDQLAIFALGEVPATRNMVFHCHGRYDDPETIVATEADYQRWYLADNEPASATFRQSLTLLFGSNPILFLGYGMEDNDLLQPLRMFIASGSASGRSRSRSLFALMPESDAAAGDKNEQMYDRYGVNVIPYPAPKTDAPPDEWGRRLCEELANIRKSWRSTRDEFVKKPVIRKVTVSVPPPKPYLHYALERSREADIAPDRTRQDLDALRELIAKPGIVAVHGLGGTGKSWRVLELLDQVSSNPRGLHFTGMFFWSSYYANDWLTGIDRALAYMEEGAEPARATRMERFRKCLEKRYLVVFDGFERLLRSEGTVAEGTPYSRAVT